MIACEMRQSACIIVPDHAFVATAWASVIEECLQVELLASKRTSFLQNQQNKHHCNVTRQ